MIHMVTVKAHGTCMVVQPQKIKWKGKNGKGYPKQGRRLL